MIVGFPCAAGMLALAEPVMLLLFPAQKESAVSAAGILAVLAVGVVFLSSVQTLTGILQGIGRQMIPVVNLLIGAGCKLILTWFLTGLPFWNVRGAAAGTVSAYLVASILNIRAVRRHTGARFDLSLTFLRPGIASAIMGFAAWLLFRVLSPVVGNIAGTGVAVLAGILLYVLLVFVLKIVTSEELEQFPGGKRLSGIFRKIRKK